jgi:pilus assembly protein CpaE
MRPGRRGEGGQATIELVALLPALAAVAMAILQLLAAGATAEYAGHAAEAGALALLQERDPVQAVRDSLPSWSRRRVTVRVLGRRVRVRLRPPALVPVMSDVLASSAEARAG